MPVNVVMQENAVVPTGVRASRAFFNCPPLARRASRTPRRALPVGPPENTTNRGRRPDENPELISSRLVNRGRVGSARVRHHQSIPRSRRQANSSRQILPPALFSSVIVPNPAGRGFFFLFCYRILITSPRRCLMEKSDNTLPRTSRFPNAYVPTSPVTTIAPRALNPDCLRGGPCKIR